MLCAGDIVLFIIFIIPIFPKRTTLIFKVDVSKTVSFAKMDRFSSLENLIKIKTTGNCNAVFSDCLISVENWSGAALQNKPTTDSSEVGVLITFNLNRKTQLYISGTGLYTRVNQSYQTENDWTAWVKSSN